MGNSDRWTTPKQIKIEREGEPRGARRGPLKKGDRRKGKKARIDELLSSKKSLLQYAQWILDERLRRINHPDWYRPRADGLKQFDPRYGEWFDRHTEEHLKLLAAALKDGVIVNAEEWIVEKP